MRDRSSTRRAASHQLRPIDPPPPLRVSRTFDPAAIDLDDLAEAVRQLLEIPEESRLDSHLLLKRRRVSHVMGAEGAPAN